ncbi:MAG: heat-inducible transcriptional repressor HrcA [Longimicrobiales bacterium]|nr:heat-inducible transcriptional repressor HrcA [Longimicrobiales bacterium]
MPLRNDTTPSDEHLTDRELQVLEAVVRSYVERAEPAGSRTISRDFDLGVSPATVRNTMSDLEAKGYLDHPHASAGRVPTDRAYRYFVDRLMQPADLSLEDESRLVSELEASEFPAVEHLVRRATQALSMLSLELGLAVAPRLDDARLEKIDFVRVSADKVLMIATIESGVARTIYVDLPGGVPGEILTELGRILNERLAGQTLAEIRRSLPERLRDPGVSSDAAELLNIFLQSGTELFRPAATDESNVHIGRASVLTLQPEFTSGERLKGLIELTEQRGLLARALSGRDHERGLSITIGTENASEALSDFTLVTAEYAVGDLKGVIGVIGPTRMPYEKIISIVGTTSRLVSNLLTP